MSLPCNPSSVHKWTKTTKEKYDKIVEAESEVLGRGADARTKIATLNRHISQVDAVLAAHELTFLEIDTFIEESSTRIPAVIWETFDELESICGERIVNDAVALRYSGQEKSDTPPECMISSELPSALVAACKRFLPGAQDIESLGVDEISRLLERSHEEMASLHAKIRGTIATTIPPERLQQLAQGQCPATPQRPQKQAQPTDGYLRYSNWTPPAVKETPSLVNSRNHWEADEGQDSNTSGHPKGNNLEEQLVADTSMDSVQIQIKDLEARLEAASSTQDNLIGTIREYQILLVTNKILGTQIDPIRSDEYCALNHMPMDLKTYRLELAYTLNTISLADRLSKLDIRPSRPLSLGSVHSDSDRVDNKDDVLEPWQIENTINEM